MKFYSGAIALLVCAAASGSAETLQNIKGLSQPLEILRDKAGVPHIRAKNEADAHFGHGFVQAQDRLWQLEYLRRLGYGRLAEILPPAVEADKLFRILGVSRSAVETWATFKGSDKLHVEAFVAGLNAATNLQRGSLPLEFTTLAHQPEPFTPVDVLVIAKVLAWATDQNWTQELVRAQVAARLGAQSSDWLKDSERVRELMPAYTADGPTIVPPKQAFASKFGLKTNDARMVPDEGVLADLIRFHNAVAQLCGVGGQGIGSSNLALSSDRSTTRKPLLAADPHLPSQMPSMMYRVHVSGGPLDVIGVALVGLPGVTMGHNGHMAWGWTNVNADVQDLYIEQIANGKYLSDGTWKDVIKRPETIKVRGAADVTFDVISTGHGPIVTSLVDPSGAAPAMALRWSALDTDDDIGLRAMLVSNRANNEQQFLSAFRGRKAHPQNMIYAHKGGDIGYVLVGTIPDRKAGDGSAPVPGWVSAFDWKGYVPFDQLPAVSNPQFGFLTSSNNRVIAGASPHIGSSYAAPYRATRLRELIMARPRLAPEDLEDFQGDLLATHARELMPFLLSVPLTGKEKDAADLLRTWDLKATSTSAATAVFEAWYLQLASEIFGDELGDALFAGWSKQMHMVSMALSHALLTKSKWCDNINTVETETCEVTAANALTKALSNMAVRQGKPATQTTPAEPNFDVASWQWGKAHRALFFHQPFDDSLAPQPVFSRRKPSAGDKHTLNVGSAPEWGDFDQRHLALYRQVIDLGNWENSRWMATPGQSGVLTSPHYDDLIDPWLRSEYHPMLYSKKALDAVGPTQLQLLPAN